MLQLGPPARPAGPAGPGPGVTRGQRPALVQGPGQPQVQVQQSPSQSCRSSLPSLLSRRPPRSDSPSFSTAILRSRDAGSRLLMTPELTPYDPTASDLQYSDSS